MCLLPAPSAWNTWCPIFTQPALPSYSTSQCFSLTILRKVPLLHFLSYHPVVFQYILPSEIILFKFSSGSSHLYVSHKTVRTLSVLFITIYFPSAWCILDAQLVEESCKVDGTLMLQMRERAQKTLVKHLD